MNWRPRALQLILVAAGARVPTPQSPARRPLRCTQHRSCGLGLILAREFGRSVGPRPGELLLKSQSESKKDHIV